MIGRGFKTDVLPVEGYAHHWRVVSAAKEIADSQDIDDQPASEFARRPSQDGSKNLVSSASPQLNTLFRTTI